jgi:ketosteroid isomerase-like protein
MGIAKELVDRQHQLLRQRNVAAVPELYTPDAVFLMPGLRVHPHELPALMQAYLAAFPDADNQVTGWIEAPEGIAVEQTITGTHSGTWVTPFGELAATGKRVRWESVEIVRVRDGKIASWRSYFDQLEALTALGVAPGPPTQ